MKQYLLMVIYPPGSTQPPPDELETIMENVNGLHNEMKEAGAWVFGGGLHPSNTASVARPQGQNVLVTDGPFAESKEQIGGICILNAPDLESALAWAGKLAVATTVPVEVRPIQDGSYGD